MNIILRILMDAFFIALLIWCSYTDIRKRIVFNVSVILLICLDAMHMVLIGFTIHTWWTYPLGLVFALPFLIAWMKNGMGAGDVKLVITISLYLGLLNTIIAFTLMVPVIIILIIRTWIKQKTLQCRIPFAPVLVFGAIGAVIAGYLYTFIYI